jgi:hypothetical protein
MGGRSLRPFAFFFIGLVAACGVVCCGVCAFDGGWRLLYIPLGIALMIAAIKFIHLGLSIVDPESNEYGIRQMSNPPVTGLLFSSIRGKSMINSKLQLVLRNINTIHKERGLPTLGDSQERVTKESVMVVSRWNNSVVNATHDVRHDGSFRKTGESSVEFGLGDGQGKTLQNWSALEDCVAPSGKIPLNDIVWQHHFLSAIQLNLLWFAGVLIHNLRIDDQVKRGGVPDISGLNSESQSRTIGIESHRPIYSEIDGDPRSGCRFKLLLVDHRLFSSFTQSVGHGFPLIAGDGRISYDSEQSENGDHILSGLPEPSYPIASFLGIIVLSFGYWYLNRSNGPGGNIVFVLAIAAFPVGVILCWYGFNGLLVWSLRF